MIDPASDLAVDDAALVAEALVIHETGPGAHFTSAARNFLRGLGLYVAIGEREDLCTLLYMRHLLTLDGKRFDTLLHDMQADERSCLEVGRVDIKPITRIPPSSAARRHARIFVKRRGMQVGISPSLQAVQSNKIGN